ncbi:unnamed protein product, partial [Fusarium langsethiae]
MNSHTQFGQSLHPNHILNSDTTVQSQHQIHTTDWFAGQSGSASTTPASSASAAAVRWFGILANDAPNEEVLE